MEIMCGAERKLLKFAMELKRKYNPRPAQNPDFRRFLIERRGMTPDEADRFIQENTFDV